MEYYQFIAVMDNRTTPICQSLDGEIFPIVELSQGENAPPMHVRCRSTICASDGESKRGSRIAKDSDGKRIKNPAEMRYSDWKAVYIDKTRTLEDWREDKTLKEFGALTDKNDPTGKKRDAHAELFYKEWRNSKKEFIVLRIAENSGMRIKAVDKVFNHVFIKEHDLWDGRHRFDPSYDMAESFRRLSEGKDIQAHDLIMLKHEWMELNLMQRYGYDYDTAHEITARKYNYKAALIEWYESRGMKWNG